MKLTPDQSMEFELLARASERHKVAVPIGALLGPERQAALERLQERDWLRLLDVSPIAAGHGFELHRVFLVTSIARDWMRLVRATRQ